MAGHINYPVPENVALRIKLAAEKKKAVEASDAENTTSQLERVIRFSIHTRFS